jgi:hypothetical protein
MGKIRRAGLKHCAVCGRFFRPSPRQGDKQVSCSQAACQRERKRRSQKAWSLKNPDYFKGRYANTKAWRAENPDYQRQRRKKRHEIQDAIGAASPLRAVRILVPVKALKSEIQDSIWMQETCSCGFMMAGWAMRDTRHDRTAAETG